MPITPSPKCRTTIARSSKRAKKLGPEAAKRGAPVKQFLIAKVGAEVAGDWSARFHKASDIEALEKIAGIYKREVATVRDGGQAGAPSPNMASGLWPKRLGVTRGDGDGRDAIETPQLLGDDGGLPMREIFGPAFDHARPGRGARSIACHDQ